jgi:hypothetical protein
VSDIETVREALAAKDDPWIVAAPDRIEARLERLREDNAELRNEMIAHGITIEGGRQAPEWNVYGVDGDIELLQGVLEGQHDSLYVEALLRIEAELERLQGENQLMQGAMVESGISTEDEEE